MKRRVAMMVPAGILVALLLGCFTNLDVTPGSAETTAGEPVEFRAISSEGFCSRENPMDYSAGASWFVDGKPVDGNVITIEEPGEYEVTARLTLPGNDSPMVGGPSKLVVKPRAASKEASAAAEDEIAYSKDVPEPADPATLEEIMISGSGMAVFNGGKPATWKLDRDVRIREIWTYHWNEEKGKVGGTIYIKRLDGSRVGEFPVTRTMPGQGGVPNAYWVADVDLELPAGTYVMSDSDPASWAQNDETGGVGMVWVKVAKQ